MLKKILNSAILMSWASYFVNFGSNLIVFPLLIKVYDDVEVSFWFLVSTIVGFAMMADTGFGSALQRAVAYFNAGAKSLPKDKKEYDSIEEIEDKRPNYKQLNNLLATSGRIYNILSFISLAFVMIGGTAIIWNVFRLSGHRIDLWLGFLLLIPDTFILMNSIKWSSFMKGLNFIAVEARISSVIGVVKVVVFTVLLTIGAKPVYLIGFMLLADTFRLFYIRHYIKSWFRKTVKPNIKEKPVFSKSIFTSLWAASWRLGGIFWGNYFVEQGDNIIIAQVSEPKTIASFLITKKILEIFRSISITTFYAKIPIVFELAAQKKLSELKSFASGYMFFGLFIIVSAYTAIILFGNPLLEFFNIEKRLIDLPVLILICATMILDIHSSYHAGIYTSTNHIPFLIPSVASGVVIFAVGFNIVDTHGIYGVVLVRFIVQLLFNNWYAPYLSLRLLNWRVKKYIYEFPLMGIRFMINLSRRIIK
jgi:O-antigen/teichoic acid export membrane protein